MNDSQQPGLARSPSSRVTAAVVAHDAGVSVATVSLVVNGKSSGRVSPDVVTRVLDSVSKLGYIVDESARMLSSGSSRAVFLVAPDLSNPFFCSVIAGVREALREDYVLLTSISDTGKAPRSEDVKKLLGFRTAGLLVSAPSAEFIAHWSSVTPTVLIDAAGLDKAAPAVDLDVASGAVELAGHLAGRGHRRAAYLDSRTPSATFQTRREHFWATAKDFGLEEVHPVSISSTTDLEDAARAFELAWPMWRRAGASAVVCATDIQAYGVLAAARRLRVAVPGDLAVTGFDDLPYSKISNPSLTTVALPGHELGVRAAALLQSLMESTPQPWPGGAVSGQLVVRDST
jgi:LacI family transcriptional regulator, galactose operon repressor